MDFDLESTMRKHDETLRHYRERVEQDQRDAGLLLAGASLADYGVNETPVAKSVPSVPSGGYAAAAPPADRYQAPMRQPQPRQEEPDLGYDMMGFGGGFEREPQRAPSSYAPQGYGQQTPGRRDQMGMGGPMGDRQATSVSTPAARGVPQGRRQQEPEHASPATTRRGGAKTAHPLRVYERVSQWQRRKHQKLDEERRKTQKKELENCPFEPVTRSTKAQHPWEQKSGSIYGGNGRAWGYDEFVERQREARRRTNEKKDAVKSSGKNWKNEVTVCQEFNLGRRDKSVRALQKPLSPPTFVPSVSEHHHLVKEISTLSQDSPLTQLQGAALPARGLFSERISTAIIDNTMLHPQGDADGADPSAAHPRGGSASPYRADESAMAAESEWARRAAEKQAYESQHMYR
eukprot:TRINITY_DN24683_c0_g1_i1.p1 TRINITY_DN24683_c0_g1~~TRINITY_DN24683_c0_g1_i1.p1  ORF type:complete len:425 (+),score=150.03 TRINITY_DN24683_c0_g1_i1:66-1277(+)